METAFKYNSSLNNYMLYLISYNIMKPKINRGLYIFYLIMILFIIFFSIWILPKINLWKESSNVVITDFSEESNKSLVLLNTGENNNNIDTNINSWKNDNFILEKGTCNFEYTGSYKYLDLYDSEFSTPIQKPTVSQYTKQINITWNIEEVKVCILADVRPDHKWKWDYSFEVKAYLWNDTNAGYINVWYAKPYLYDKDSKGARNNNLYWRFDWNETPFKQVIDLERVIIADIEWNEYYKYIRPIVNFEQPWTIRIWAYVEWDSHRYAWRILQFRIVYKWGSISK